MRHDTNLQQLSTVSGFSESRIRHADKEAFGLTPSAFIHELRMACAARLLCNNPELTIAKIAEMCGYRHLSLFASHVARALGATPRAVRKRSMAIDD